LISGLRTRSVSALVLFRAPSAFAAQCRTPRDPVRLMHNEQHSSSIESTSLRRDHNAAELIHINPAPRRDIRLGWTWKMEAVE
jgi:hypothetical protein